MKSDLVSRTFISGRPTRYGSCIRTDQMTWTSVPRRRWRSFDAGSCSRKRRTPMRWLLEAASHTSEEQRAAQHTVHGVWPIRVTGLTVVGEVPRPFGAFPIADCCLCCQIGQAAVGRPMVSQSPHEGSPSRLDELSSCAGPFRRPGDQGLGLSWSSWPSCPAADI